MSDNFAVIMAGGIGSRFWPISRTSNPKQFLDILGTGRTLIQMTYDRLSHLFDPSRIFVVTNVEYAHLVREQLPGVLNENILLEPMLKNTAPCIAYSVYKIFARYPEANISILPSDHLITDEHTFLSKLGEALDFVSFNDAIVTLGITPTRPDAGYGYIQFYTEETPQNIYRVKTFTEKPTIEIAETFLQSGDFLWNAGIFISSARTWIEAFEKHLPDLHELFRSGMKFFNTPQESDYIERSYPLCSVISIDYGIIEKARNVYVIPSSIGWSDLGTWRSVKELVPSNEEGNVVIGKNVINRDTTNCLVFNSTKGVIVLQGVSDLLVVESKDALLICNLEQEQEVRMIVSDIKDQYNGKYN